jgi:hypothetical protein
VQRQKQIFLGFCLFIVSACTTAPPAPPADISITFQHRQPIVLRVATVDVVDQHVPTLAPPHVEHLHSVTPASVVYRWANERLKTAGQRGQVSIIVTEAGVIEQALQTTSGVGGLFSDEPDTKLLGVISARFEHVDVGPPARSSSVNIQVEASVEVLESATLNERDLAYFRVVEKLAGEFDRVMTEQVNTNLGSLIVR